MNEEPLDKSGNSVLNDGKIQYVSMGDDWDVLTDHTFDIREELKKIAKNTNDISYHLAELSFVLSGLFEALVLIPEGKTTDDARKEYKDSVWLKRD